MFKNKRILTLALVISLVIGIFSFGMATEKQYVGLVTGGPAGTYFPVGGAVAEVINEALPDIEITAETGNASIANLNLMFKQEIETALVQNDNANWAYNGTVLFEGREPIKNVRLIASFFPEHIHIATLKRSNINTFKDLRGKKVSIGEIGSGAEADAKIIFDLLDLSFNDFKVFNLGHATTTEYMKDYQLDASFQPCGYPASNFTDLAQTREINFVSFTDEEVEKICKKYPYFVKSVIPAGTYKGVDIDVQTVAIMCLWVADSELDEDVVYKMTEALFSEKNLARIHLAHMKAKSITLETALDGASIPLHLGALKYYQEKGLQIPDSLIPPEAK